MSLCHPTPLQLAVHEAGHAYAFAALTRGSCPWELGLTVDGREVRGWSRRQTLLHREVPFDAIPDDAMPSVRWQAAAEGVIAIAGPLAECWTRHRSRLAAALLLHVNADGLMRDGAFDQDGDFQKVRDTLGYMRIDEGTAAFKRLVDVADAVLADNWPAIRQLGRQLLERRLLDEGALATWFDANPASRWTEGLTV